MTIQFTETGWEDLIFWAETDMKIVKKITRLINSIRKKPFDGIGKPEALKHNYSGYWSRRIDQENRLVYKIIGTKGIDQYCVIIQCKFHYK